MIIEWSELFDHLPCCMQCELVQPALQGDTSPCLFTKGKPCERGLITEYDMKKWDRYGKKLSSVLLGESSRSTVPLWSSITLSSSTIVVCSHLLSTWLEGFLQVFLFPPLSKIRIDPCHLGNILIHFLQVKMNSVFEVL